MSGDLTTTQPALSLVSSTRFYRFNSGICLVNSIQFSAVAFSIEDLILVNTWGGIRVIQPFTTMIWSLRSINGKSHWTKAGNLSGGTFLDINPAMAACSLVLVRSLRIWYKWASSLSKWILRCECNTAVALAVESGSGISRIASSPFTIMSSSRWSIKYALATRGVTLSTAGKTAASSPLAW